MSTAALNTRGVHVFEKDKKRNTWYLKSINPIQWFVNEDTRIAIQNGQFFTGSGEVIPQGEVPTWVHEAVSKLTPQHRASLGLKEAARKAN